VIEIVEKKGKSDTYLTTYLDMSLQWREFSEKIKYMELSANT